MTTSANFMRHRRTRERSTTHDAHKTNNYRPDKNKPLRRQKDICINIEMRWLLLITSIVIWWLAVSFLYLLASDEIVRLLPTSISTGAAANGIRRDNHTRSWWWWVLDCTAHLHFHHHSRFCHRDRHLHLSILSSASTVQSEKDCNQISQWAQQQCWLE